MDIGRGIYGDRLLQLIDQCLAIDWRERPCEVRDVIERLEGGQDIVFAAILRDIPWKMVNHFMNWARPNSGLIVNEFVAFLICFSVADLSWRIGKGAGDRAVSLRLLNLVPPQLAVSCVAAMVKKGFSAKTPGNASNLILSRLDEYAAAYLLDRQEKEWHYRHTLHQLARHCLAESHAADGATFSSLMEDVIDRARGRTKKEFNKIFRNVVHRVTDGGWVKEVVDPGSGR